MIRWRDIDNASLRRALIDPRYLSALTLTEWDRLIPQARAAALLARLDALRSGAGGAAAQVPPEVQPHLVASKRIAESEARGLLWEVNRISRALEGLAAPVVLLKGAAYTLCDLPNARGRVSSDVDVLVPKSRIDAVEKCLLDHGWEHIKLNPYDQYFYRQWSHELPPLQHRERGTVVDVHHTILPPTGRLRPDPDKLLAAAVPLPGTRFHVLAPADMVLHSAAHGFQDGDLKRGLRDLVDIDDLLRHFGQTKGFWHTLAGRAEELDLTRPLYYAVRFAQRYLQTPVGSGLADKLPFWAPPWPASFIMDKVVGRVVTAGPWDHGHGRKLSERLLYMRAHWLRMPPHLLLPHLLRKLLRKRNEHESN